MKKKEYLKQSSKLFIKEQALKEKLEKVTKKRSDLNNKAFNEGLDDDYEFEEN